MYHQRRGRPTGGGPRWHGAHGYPYEDALRAYPPRRGHRHSSLDDRFDISELEDELDDGLDDGLDDDSLGFSFLGSDLKLEDDDHSDCNVPPGFCAVEHVRYRLGYRHDDIPGRGRQGAGQLRYPDFGRGHGQRQYRDRLGHRGQRGPGGYGLHDHPMLAEAERCGLDARPTGDPRMDRHILELLDWALNENGGRFGPPGSRPGGGGQSGGHRHGQRQGREHGHGYGYAGGRRHGDQAGRRHGGYGRHGFPGSDDESY